MAPIIEQQIADTLAKRAIFYTGYNNSNRPWWLVFAIGVPIILLILLFVFRHSNRKRRTQGIAPIPYTGWTAFNTNSQNNPPQNYNQQPYQQYGQQPQQPQHGGYYYKQEEDAAPPAYQRPDGPPPNNQTFDRPEGPPPSEINSNIPTYPEETYKR